MALISVDISKKLNGPEGPFDLNAKFGLNKGEFLGIFGPSGAGKTSILKMIAGLLNPDQGEININNEDWFTSRVNLKTSKRNIGYVFQEYALFPNMSVRQNIAFGMSEKSDQFVMELARMVGLERLMDQRPNSLSGGQQQRVALARAMARKPSILLLDEPFSSLDEKMRSTLQEVTINLHRRFNTTSIIVSHDIGELFKLSSRMMELKEGQLREIKSVDELFSDRSISGKFKFSGQIIEIKKADAVHTLQVLIGNNLVKVVITSKEAGELQVGDHVLVVSKAFNPMIIKKTT